MKNLLLVMLSAAVLSSCTTTPTEVIPWDQKCATCGYKLNNPKRHAPAKKGGELRIMCVTPMKEVTRKFTVTETEWIEDE